MQAAAAHNILPYLSSLFANQCHFIARFEIFNLVFVEYGAMTPKLKRLLLEFPVKWFEIGNQWKCVHANCILQMSILPIECGTIDLKQAMCGIWICIKSINWLSAVVQTIHIQFQFRQFMPERWLHKRWQWFILKYTWIGHFCDISFEIPLIDCEVRN